MGVLDIVPVRGDARPDERLELTDHPGRRFDWRKRSQVVQLCKGAPGTV